ncbi:MAG: alpha-amylase family glycosyl hydrolase [Anaerolineales bacterium]|jgi:sucrose phosphorylase
MNNPRDRIRFLLTNIYDDNKAFEIWSSLKKILTRYHNEHKNLTKKSPLVNLSERDVMLISYGDQIFEPGIPALETLFDFIDTYLEEVIQCVHILPFYPYTSDDGFSITNYRQVNSTLGTWRDIVKFSKRYRLMFDAVINHVSQDSEWFKKFKRHQAPYDNFFITIEPDTDISSVTRPRASPLITPIMTNEGTVYVWTTFSDDQIDLNYKEPKVLLEIIDLLLFYIDKGAQFIRLDAIAYLWKEVGTSCIHLPQTHAIVKLIRAVLDAVAPSVILITETNVPHAENISYFGNPLPTDSRDELYGIDDQNILIRGDESQIVYQFPLAPLVLYTFLTGKSVHLTEWAAGIEVPFPTATFLNFIASHDGIGVRPVEGILNAEEIQALVDRTISHGGQVSHKMNHEGSSSVYELNITLFDALNDPTNPKPQEDIWRFIASQVIMLSLKGIPGIYIHSLFGSRNYRQGVIETGRARSINREKFSRPELEKSLDDPANTKSQVFSRYKKILHQRTNCPAFHPFGKQVVFNQNPSVFSLLRFSPNENEVVLCLVNVSDKEQPISLWLSDWQLQRITIWRDLIKGDEIKSQSDQLNIHLQPYQSCWLYAEI